jgi:hypothetical protein
MTGGFSKGAQLHLVSLASYFSRSVVSRALDVTMLLHIEFGRKQNKETVHRFKELLRTKSISVERHIEQTARTSST